MSASNDKMFAAVALGLSAVFIGLGFVFASPVAVASLVAVQIIAAPALLGVQLYAKKSSEAASLVMGFSADRTMGFAEIIGEASGSSAGILVAKAVQVASIVSSLKAIVDARQDEKNARTQLLLASAALERIDKVYDTFGNSNAAWGSAIRKIAGSGADRIEELVEATKDRGCLLLSPTGPTIRQR